MSNQRSTIIGTVTDLNYQIEVRISSGGEKKSFVKGVYVKLTGTIVHSFTPPHFGLESFTEIEIIEDIEWESFKNLQKGFRLLQKSQESNESLKRNNEENNSENNDAGKKMKVDWKKLNLNVALCFTI